MDHGPRTTDHEPSIIAGRNPVREALQRGDRSIEKVLVQQGAQGGPVAEIRRAAKAAGVPVQVVPAARLNQLAPGVGHQGVVALAAAVGYADLDAMLEAIAPTLDAVRARKPVLLALDGIEDPHNFGAILRSAVAAGAAGVVVPDRGQAPLSAAAVKASAGTADRLPVARVTNLAEALFALKERGYWVVGLDGGEGGGAAERTTVWAYDWDRPIVLVVGSEGGGMRPRVRSACDLLVAIPMRGPAESLNASVAAGIALFAAVRERAP
jgi:23S rRNA (guanosine2251-2'-O)-methyltransferase